MILFFSCSFTQKGDVARVEEDLVKIIAGGAIEDVHEELVDFTSGWRTMSTRMESQSQTKWS